MHLAVRWCSVRSSRLSSLVCRAFVACQPHNAHVFGWSVSSLGEELIDGHRRVLFQAVDGVCEADRNIADDGRHVSRCQVGGHRSQGFSRKLDNRALRLGRWGSGAGRQLRFSLHYHIHIVLCTCKRRRYIVLYPNKLCIQIYLECALTHGGDAAASL